MDKNEAKAQLKGVIANNLAQLHETLGDDDQLLKAQIFNDFVTLRQNRGLASDAIFEEQLSYIENLIKIYRG